jgi:long-chain fatty acid transport protein
MQLKRTVIAGSVMAVLAAMSGTAAASGFALIEQSASGLGNAYAGGAASAEDASTIFFNPAGMSLIKGRQLVLAGHAIGPSARLSNQGSTTATSPLGAPVALTGGNGGNAGDWALVPNFYYSADINPQTKFGLGINAPFGLKTEYDAGWVGRYQALKSDLKTININPSIAYRVNDSVSVGVGVSYQYANAELTKAIDFGTVCSFTALAAACAGAGITPQSAAGDGVAKIEGNDWSWGYNLGALFQVAADTRIGVAYRSEIRHELSGNAAYTKPAALPAPLAGAASVTDTGVKASVTLPDSLSLSIMNQMSPKLALMGDVSWTRWSRFQELRIRFGNGAADSVTPENWRDTYRISAGATYQYSDAWKSRIGIAFDQTPVTDQFRTPRIPDNDRTWISVGASYKVSPNGLIDFGYAHLFVKDAPINKAETLSSSLPSTLTETLRGNYKNSVDILSVQYTHSF